MLDGGPWEFSPGLADVVISPKQTVSERISVEGKPSVRVGDRAARGIHGVEQGGTPRTGITHFC